MDHARKQQVASRALAMVILVLGVLSPLAAAQNSGETGSGADGLITTCVPTRELSAISGVITASNIDACITAPTIVHRSSLDSNGATTGYATVRVVINVAGPDIPTGGTVSYTYTPTAFIGCNIGTTGQIDTVLAAGSGSTFRALVDMTGEYCEGYILIQITAAVVPTTVFQAYMPVDIRAEQAFLSTTNVVNSGTLDITDRLCAASAIGSSCTTPTINAAVTGSLTLSGTLNEVLSGTVSLAGGLTLTDDANGWAIHQDPISGSLTLSGSMTNTVSGALTISDDAGGWAVHQDPISGTIALTGIPDTQDELTAMANAINSLNRLRIQICGQSGDVETGACGPIQANVNGTTTVNIGNSSVNNTVPATSRGESVADEWVPVGFFALLIAAAGFITATLIRATLVGLGGTGIFVSWLSGAPIGVRGIIALIACVVVIFVLTRAWRERQAKREAGGE